MNWIAIIWGGLVGLGTWWGIRWGLRKYGRLDLRMKRMWPLLVGGLAVLGGYAGKHWTGFWAYDVPVVTGWLLGVILIDSYTRRIPNLWLGGMAIWAGIQVVLGHYPRWFDGLAAGLSLGWVFWMISRVGRGALGMGDVKFMAVSGLLLGLRYGWQGGLFGVILGGIGIALLMALGRVSRRDYVAYGPYLALGMWIAFMRMVQGRG